MSVTLLFTDIEGSTRIVQQLGDRYAAVLEEHRRAVRAALAASGGAEIDCRGDEFSIAFPDAANAVDAARAIQRSHVGDVRVRIGIHTGEPLRIDGGYVGLDVHRAARICAAGHGGQILLSQATADAVGEGVELRDLGEHLLRGLEQPERIHQLGDAEFDALRADIADDGIGGADPELGSGLRGLIDRVAALDSTVAINSPPGGGTTVRAELPLRVEVREPVPQDAG